MNDNTLYTSNDGIIHNPDSCEPLEQAWLNNEIELQALKRGTYAGYPLNDNDLTSIKNIGYWNASKKQIWGLDWHRNEGIEICFLETGSLEFELNQHIHHLSPNTLTITRPWIPHRLGNPNIDSSKLHWFIIDVEVRQPHQEWIWPDWIILNKENLNTLTNILRRNEQPVWKVGPEIKKCFVQIGHHIKENKKAFLDSKIKILINEILILLLELFTQEKPLLNDSLIKSQRSVAIFLKDLDSMLTEHWSLKKMAEYCGLGSTQFSKYCHEITNSTPMNYLTQLRIKKARDLIIQHTNKSITEIAFDCGFSSNQYFTQVFKKHYKIAPMEYRISKLRAPK